jgi:hypothetical protein
VHNHGPLATGPAIKISPFEHVVGAVGEVVEDASAQSAAVHSRSGVPHVNMPTTHPDVLGPVVVVWGGSTHPSAATQIRYALVVASLHVISPTMHFVVVGLVVTVQSATAHIRDPAGIPQVIEPTVHLVAKVLLVQLAGVADPAGELG